MASNRAKYPKEMKTGTAASIVDSERSTTSMYDFPAHKKTILDLVGGDGSHQSKSTTLHLPRVL
jgi:hypothetical protein